MDFAAQPDLAIRLTRSGAALQLEHYHARGEPRLGVVMVHGYSAHCGLYRHVGAALASAGMAVTQFDCRGHGRSDGPRGHVTCFDDYLDDLAAVVDWARAQNPALPWALMGHSMGGAIALAFALDRARHGKPARLVLVAPWLKLKMKVPAPKRLAANVAAKLMPLLTMPNGLKAENVSRNPLVLANFAADPLVHHVATAGWFMATLRAQARLRTQADKLDVPTLLLLAGQDRIVANEASLALAAAAPSVVEVRSYGDLFHEVFLEPEAEVVVGDIATWLVRGDQMQTA